MNCTNQYCYSRSIQVVFHKMAPNETLFLESTNKIYKDDISSSSFVNFQIWDFPGQVDFFDPTFDYEMIFRGTGALIFVIDAQVIVLSLITVTNPLRNDLPLVLKLCVCALCCKPVLSPYARMITWKLWGGYI